MDTTKPQIDPNKLREARKKAGLTQQDMGSVLNLTKTQISNIESGYSGIKSDDLYVWAKLCKIEIDKLYSFAPEGAFNVRKKNLQKC